MTTFQKIVCAFLVLGLMLGGFGLYIINRSVENLQLLSHNDYGGYDDFDENYLAIRMAEELAQQQDSHISRLKQELRAPDGNAFQATLAVTAYPKEYTDNTTAQLVYQDKTVHMEFAAGAFKGEIAVPLDADAVDAEYMVLLNSGGVTRSQFASLDFEGFANGTEVFGWNETTVSSSSAQHALDIALEIDETFLPFGDQLTSARVYAKYIAAQNLAGKELFSEKMNGNVLQLNQTFVVTPGEEIMVYGEVLGKSGLTYVYPLCRISFYDDMVQEESCTWENLRMIGANGQELEVALNY